DVAVWRATALGPAVIGEFAFQLRFERDAPMHHKARKHADELFTRLQTTARQWLALGGPKTAGASPGGERTARRTRGRARGGEKGRSRTFHPAPGGTTRF